MAAASTATTDEQLVAAIRDGSDEALEALFRRYRDRLGAYVRGMVPDHGRAEDVVQETFISALRSLRATDQPIVFRPWIYQIARNACIDQIRRQKRAEEISIDSEDFKPQEEGRLSQATPTTDSAVSQREDMGVLRQAFGSLPASQHEALVLRELAGLSYAEIGDRMSLTPAAVESMLFRARRGLRDEYEEIATGERCRRIQAVIAAVAEGLGGVRERRELARHVYDCAHCRHEAVAMGLGALVRASDRRGRFRRALDKAAALLPIPPFLRRGDAGASGVEHLGVRAQSALSNLGLINGPGAEQTAGMLSKAVVVMIAAALIGGGGFVGHKSGASVVPPSSPTDLGAASFGGAAGGSHGSRSSGGTRPTTSSGSFNSPGGSYQSSGAGLGTFSQPYVSFKAPGLPVGVQGEQGLTGTLLGESLGSLAPAENVPSVDLTPSGEVSLPIVGTKKPRVGKGSLPTIDTDSTPRGAGRHLGNGGGIPRVPGVPPGLSKKDPSKLPLKNPHSPSAPTLPSSPSTTLPSTLLPAPSLPDSSTDTGLTTPTVAQPTLPGL